MKNRLLVTMLSCFTIGFQLQAARMSDADLAKLTRVTPPGGLVVLSDDEEKQNTVNKKLFDALDLRYVHDVINAVKQALKEGADINHKEAADGNTPLIKEASKNLTPEALEIIDILLQAGSDINAGNKYDNETSLMSATSSGNKNVVRHLLNAGADTTLKDIHGETALDKAKDRASEYLDFAKGYAKTAKEYDRIPVNKDGGSEFSLGRSTLHFSKSDLTKKYFRQQSQKYYRAYFDAIKIVKILEKANA